MVGAMWDEMYAGEDYRYGRTPNAWVVRCEADLPRGARVLCVGDGEGRNGVWLAEQGHDVVTVDASARGVEKARALAAERGVAIDARVGLFPAAVPEGAFDAVVLIFVHVPAEARAGLHRAALDHLAPGGRVVLEAFRPEQLALGSGGPRNPAMLFAPAQLAEDFADAEVLALDDAEVELDEGPGHRGLAAVVRLLARRR